MPQTIEFNKAPAEIAGVLARVPTDHTPIVAITGPTGAGKSTLAARIADAVFQPQHTHPDHNTPALVLSTDRYLPDYDTLDPNEVDEPHHARLDRLARDLASLRQGRPTPVPVWSFHTHRPEGEQTITPAGLVIVEGLFALHELAAAQADIRILIEAARDTRWSRVEARELSGDRGWGVERSRHHFDHVADKTFNKYHPTYRTRADYIVTNNH